MVALIAAVILTTVACQKENSTPSKGANNLTYESIEGANGSNFRGSNLDPVIDLGEIITSTEANSRIARWSLIMPNKHTGSRLSSLNYDRLREVPNTHGLALTYSDSCGLLAFAVDSENDPIMSLVFKLDDSGGFELTEQETSDYIESFDNSENLFPGTITLGFDLLDSVIEQYGADGIYFSNALDLVDGDDYLDVIATAYNSSGARFGIDITVGAKICRVWVPQQDPPIGCHGCFPIPGHWRDCDLGEFSAWITSGWG